MLGQEKPCAFDSGGHVTFAMKLVELNLFVWILYYSWDHYIGDEVKKMEKNVLLKFDCFSDPATISPRWKRWLTSFELYVDGKGLIISEGATAAT